MTLFNLFSRSIKFNGDSRSSISVLDSAATNKKTNAIISGDIKSVDFDKRVVTIHGITRHKQPPTTMQIKFDDIVTLSRMKDGRLRMWINVEG